MKKRLLMAGIIFCTISVFAQNNKRKNKEVVTYEIEEKTYQQALRYGDVGVAVNSLYVLLAKHPDNNSYKDSLARIYFQVGSYNQCLRVCEELLVAKPNDTTTLRMMAMSYKSLGNAVEAIAEFEKVVKLTGNVYDTYQKAALEYNIKRLQESKISIELVLKLATDKHKIVLYIDQDNKQEVPLRAAAFNLYGMIAKDFNDTASARFLFDEAIKIFPEFYFANANLKALNDLEAKKPEERAPLEKKK